MFVFLRICLTSILYYERYYDAQTSLMFDRSTSIIISNVCFTIPHVAEQSISTITIVLDDQSITCSQRTIYTKYTTSSSISLQFFLARPKSLLKNKIGQTIVELILVRSTSTLYLSFKQKAIILKPCLLNALILRYNLRSRLKQTRNRRSERYNYITLKLLRSFSVGSYNVYTTNLYLLFFIMPCSCLTIRSYVFQSYSSYIIQAYYSTYQRRQPIILRYYSRALKFLGNFRFFINTTCSTVVTILNLST